MRGRRGGWNVNKGWKTYSTLNTNRCKIVSSLYLVFSMVWWTRCEEVVCTYLSLGPSPHRRSSTRALQGSFSAHRYPNQAPNAQTPPKLYKAPPPNAVHRIPPLTTAIHTGAPFNPTGSLTRIRPPSQLRADYLEEKVETRWHQIRDPGVSDNGYISDQSVSTSIRNAMRLCGRKY